MAFKHHKPMDLSLGILMSALVTCLTCLSSSLGASLDTSALFHFLLDNWLLTPAPYVSLASVPVHTFFFHHRVKLEFL
jgi:hypothetical protein